MNKRVYFLMVISFVVGIVELIISGILDLIVIDLNITYRQAGWLITIFSLIFALMSPVLLLATANGTETFVNRFLWVFSRKSGDNVRSGLYGRIYRRIISAASGALLTILCLVMAPLMVQPQYRGTL